MRWFRMKLCIKFYFSSEGVSPLEVIKRIRKIGFLPEVGDYDAVVKLDRPEDYTQVVEKLYSTMKGTKVTYTLTTKKE